MPVPSGHSGGVQERRRYAPTMAANTFGTYLDRILSAHRSRRRPAGRDWDGTIPARPAWAGEPRPFEAVLRAPDLSVIAEVKRRSPSKGALALDLDPATMAAAYARGGASCLSVLTDVEFFGGSAEDLAAARAAVTLPALRKDFTVCEADVVDAYTMGADAILLIVAALDDAELRGFGDVARALGLGILHETHDEREVERALIVGAQVIGVNQRDLRTFQVDTERAVRVGRTIPADRVRVAESGITGPSDAAVLRDAGYDAVLVGESLVRSGDPQAAVAALRAGVGPADPSQ
jgi:indole-3-glycerol phosphate synthase